METVSESSFTTNVAEWIWGKEDASRCIETLDSQCWSVVAAKLLGVAIILGACLNKAPIISNILDSKSVVGLSRTSVYGDTIVVANAAFFGLLQGHPITAWGENGALLIQSLIIVWMVFHFDASISTRERALVGTAAALYVVGVLWLLPEDYRDVLMTSNLPVLLYSRGSQVVETFKLQHTGAQSVTTTGMNLVGSLIRIFTTVKEIGWTEGQSVLVGFFLSVTLNFIMVLQFWYYRENTEEFKKDLKKKKKA